MSRSKEFIRDGDTDFKVSKLNRRMVQQAEVGRQVIHLSELLLERLPKRKDVERNQHLEERKVRKKGYS